MMATPPPTIAPSEAETIRGVYQNSAVRARMTEFLGAATLSRATALHLTAGDCHQSHHREPLPISRIPQFWENGRDISRSLWDRRSLLVDLDIEYVNFDFPAAAYLHPLRTFRIQEPVQWSVEAVLLDYGIKALHLLSGRGHHYIWRVRQGSTAFDELVRLGRLTSPPLAPSAPLAGNPSSRLTLAFAGLGLAMEYAAHRIKEIAAPMCPIPVELTAVEVGPSQHGREMVSIDVSEYGDPLATRVIRVPFSVYLKPRQQSAALGLSNSQKIPPLFCIPFSGMSLTEGIDVMRTPSAVMDLAERTNCAIPDASKSMLHLLSAYEASPLAKFHQTYYASAQTRLDLEPAPEPGNFPDLIHSPLPSGLPFCARHILERPNDLLLRPAGIERVVRTLLALGWPPRQIALLIQSKFEEDHHWGDQWTGYEPRLRADFYTRTFAGLFAVGRDNLVDFNCQSAKEEKMCFNPRCSDNLQPFRESLIHRRKNERLGCRPFNRLLL